MKYLRPRSADSGLVTVLLVSDDELYALIACVTEILRGTEEIAARPLKKLKAELETARKAL